MQKHIISLALAFSSMSLLLTAPMLAADAPITQQQQVYSTINTLGLLELMKAEGYSVSLDQDGDIFWKIDGVNTAVMVDPKGKSILFYVGFDNSDLTLEQINAWNQDKKFSRCYRNAQGRVVLEADLNLEGGVTQQRILSYLKTSRVSLSIWISELLLPEDK